MRRPAIVDDHATVSARGNADDGCAFVNAGAGCGHVAAVGDADRAVGTIAQRKNADLRGFDVARIVHRDRTVIAIGPDVDAGDWIDIAAIGDADRTVCPICLRPDAEGGWAFRLDIAAVLDGDGTAARRILDADRSDARIRSGGKPTALAVE